MCVIETMKVLLNEQALLVTCRFARQQKFSLEVELVLVVLVVELSVVVTT